MSNDVIPIETVRQAILLIRGQKVMLDRDLAALYGVETRVLNQAVRRHRERFPTDFMFLLTRKEIRNISQSVICSSSLKHARSVSAFTEQGIAMLSGVLSSPRAIRVNIAIMRTFAHLRHLLSAHADLARRLDELEQRYDEQFRVVFDAIRELMAPPDPPPKPIGFHVRERRARYGSPGKGKK
jgi:hypothetical protein